MVANASAMKENKPGEGVTPRGTGRAAYLERRRATTRRAILIAARQVFADASYVDAKIGDIIRAAEVSRATFYAHFESKLELACAIYDEIAPQTTGLFDRLSGLAPDDPQGVRQWLEDFVGIHLEHRYVTPFIAQLQLFESGFRTRILRDTEGRIDLVGGSGVAGFALAMGTSDVARRQRVRVRPLFNRVATVCAEIARGELSREDANICLELVGQEILQFFGRVK